MSGVVGKHSVEHHHDGGGFASYEPLPFTIESPRKRRYSDTSRDDDDDRRLDTIDGHGDQLIDTPTRISIAPPFSIIPDTTTQDCQHSCNNIDYQTHTIETDVTRQELDTLDMDPLPFDPTGQSEIDIENDFFDKFLDQEEQNDSWNHQPDSQGDSIAPPLAAVAAAVAAYQNASQSGAPELMDHALVNSRQLGEIEQDPQQIMTSIRERYQQQHPKTTKDESILHHLWVEFDELQKALAAISSCHRVGNFYPNEFDACCVLEKFWRDLEPTSYGRESKSTIDSAMEIVEMRQKRRKSKNSVNRAAVAHEYETSAIPLIMPWHIVLGDHSRRSKTIATKVLRYACLQTKWNVGSSNNTRANNSSKYCLALARETLGILFPRVETSERGKILTLRSNKSGSAAVTASVFAFDVDDNARFVEVHAQEEEKVVKKLFDRVTPNTDFSLEEVASAYRVMLDNRNSGGGDSVETRKFRDLLDFIYLASKQALSQTAINGLRETMDTCWAELYEPSDQG